MTYQMLSAEIWGISQMMQLSDINGQSALCDVFLRMKPERASLVTEQMIDGQKCLIIPVEDDDDIDLNGIKL